LWQTLMMEAAYFRLGDIPSMNMWTVGTSESFLVTMAFGNWPWPQIARGALSWKLLRKLAVLVLPPIMAPARLKAIVFGAKCSMFVLHKVVEVL
jgi:hypothetical protein